MVDAILVKEDFTSDDVDATLEISASVFSLEICANDSYVSAFGGPGALSQAQPNLRERRHALEFYQRRFGRLDCRRVGLRRRRVRAFPLEVE